jgi:hypothetical protein
VKWGVGATGVTWDKRDKAWRAEISAIGDDGKSQERCLGYFVNEVEVALAYDQAAAE